MFLIGIFGTGSKAVPAGETGETACPVCGSRVRFHVTQKYGYAHVFFIPLLKYGAVWFATCPSCASMFEVSAEYAKRLDADPSLAPPAGSLRLLRDNLGVRCTSCGAGAGPEDQFCRRCGRSLKGRG